MIAALVLAVCGLLPAPGPVEDAVDIIELNHYYDDEGRHVFDQMLFWEWHPRSACYHIRAWRLYHEEPRAVIENGQPAVLAPHYGLRPYRAGRYYEALWHDGETLRRVKARTYYETWTQHDPELRDRDAWPKERRRRLSGARSENGQED